MTKEDLVGAINSAVQRGSSLQQAMQSLYNAGYDSKEIDEAARAFLSKNGNNLNYSKEESYEQKKGFFSRIFSRNDKKNEPQKEKSLDSEKKSLPSQKTLPQNQNIQTQNNLPKQVVSEYSSNSMEYNKNLRRKSIFIFIFIILLLIMAGILIGIFLFEEEFISFLNNFL